MKTTRIDQYICIDTDQIVIDEMKEIIGGDYGHCEGVDREYWDKAIEAAKVILAAYTV